jgi:hypothetical protein
LSVQFSHLREHAQVWHELVVMVLFESMGITSMRITGRNQRTIPNQWGGLIYWFNRNLMGFRLLSRWDKNFREGVYDMSFSGQGR